MTDVSSPSLYGPRHVARACLLSPLVALVLTFVVVPFAEVVFRGGPINLSKALGAGVIVSLFATPIAYLATCLAGIPGVLLANRRRRIIETGTAIAAGTVVGALVSLAWCMSLNAGPVRFLSPGGFLAFAVLGTLTGALVAFVFQRLLNASLAHH